ncbi:MAG: hypothetical protein JW741_27860 [Sedimentisphaerales bacterium]|nr:hypothetical protein [Sedimentisphaerales bacterium]
MSTRSRKRSVGRGFMMAGFLLAALASSANATERNTLFNADGKINLRILCTTSVKPGRTDDFVAFLSQHFVKVGTTDYKSFQERDAKGYDVVIIDYGTARPGSPVPNLRRGYSRATVTMGVAGSEVGRRLGLKTGYL